MSTSSHINVENTTLTVRLDNPEQHNILSPTTMKDLREALEKQKEKGLPQITRQRFIKGGMRKSRLSPYKQDRLTEHFVSGSTARTAASLCGVNRKTAVFFFLRLREVISYELEAESEAMFGGEIEVDESYFGGKRKGKRGRDARVKCPYLAY